MNNIQILIDDRNYSKWEFIDENTNNTLLKYSNELLEKINPIKEKLFTKDILKVDEDGKVTVIYSPIKSMKEIAGVLMLENNKTFGRTANKKRLLYKCIPDDKHLPAFLVPYDIELGFSKINKNKYVIFRFDNWNEKHPHGILVQTLGPMDNLEVFYEYQLYCKSLHISITRFINDAKEKIENNPNAQNISNIFNNPNFVIIDRRKSEYIFTIDPHGSLDYDDGFSIQKTESGNFKVSVYIANVFFWLETFNLWKSFSKRVSTIYLPDRRRPMLPTILSELLCSLQENQDRFAFAMDIEVTPYGKLLPETVKFNGALINVRKNYIYEDPDMLETDEDYKDLLFISKKMDKNVKTSHDVVAHWMVIMNSMCGDFMYTNRFGIFRTSAYMNKTKNISVDDLPNIQLETKRIIRMWNNSSGKYIKYGEDLDIDHELMQIKSYIHITSPIRRIVDLLNQLMMLKHLGIVKSMSNNANEFIEDWLSKMDYLNASMRSIRKVQTDCELIHRCFTDSEIMKKEHTGIVFDKIHKGDDVFCYMVYLEDVKLLSKILCRVDLENYSENKFKLFLFEDEDKIKKKIRLQLLSPSL